MLVGSIYTYLGHARVEFLIQACIIATVEAEVCSSSVSIVYVVRLCIVFLKAALRKRGSMEPMEPPRIRSLVHLLGLESTTVPKCYQYNQVTTHSK